MDFSGNRPRRPCGGSPTRPGAERDAVEGRPGRRAPTEGTGLLGDAERHRPSPPRPWGNETFRGFSMPASTAQSVPLVGVVGFGGSGGPCSGSRVAGSGPTRGPGSPARRGVGREPVPAGVDRTRLVWTGPKWGRGSYPDLSVVRFGTGECVLRAQVRRWKVCSSSSLCSGQTWFVFFLVPRAEWRSDILNFLVFQGEVTTFKPLLAVSVCVCVCVCIPACTGVCFPSQYRYQGSRP